MAEYKFDCRRCANTAYRASNGMDYCIPLVEGRSPIQVVEGDGCDYLTCSEYTDEQRTVVMYETL